jgi:hypothetical protein
MLRLLGSMIDASLIFVTAAAGGLRLCSTVERAPRRHAARFHLRRSFEKPAALFIKLPEPSGGYLHCIWRVMPVETYFPS